MIGFSERSKREQDLGLRGHGAILLLAGAVFFSGCGDDVVFSDRPGSNNDLVCSIDPSQVFDGGVARDGIPALTDPDFIKDDGQGVGYLFGTDRVIGVELAGEPYAIPLNILWWHEILNMNIGGEQLVFTFCPLTGSSLGFDRSPVGGAEFGVSGLLFNNNLMMFDRRDDESLWPQMMGQARCGPAEGVTLPRVPLIEMTWDGWRALHPDTWVVDEVTGFPRDYTRYPYGNYEAISNVNFLFPMPFGDNRRPPKERVLGIPGPTGQGLAFPFLALEDQGEWAVATGINFGSSVVVLWSTSAKGGGVYSDSVNGQSLTFSATDDGIFDQETGSRWSVEGKAVSGEMEGASLDPIAEAFVVFWGAWVVFNSATQLWEG